MVPFRTVDRPFAPITSVAFFGHNRYARRFGNMPRGKSVMPSSRPCKIGASAMLSHAGTSWTARSH